MTMMDAPPELDRFAPLLEPVGGWPTKLDSSPHWCGLEDAELDRLRYLVREAYEGFTAAVQYEHDEVRPRHHLMSEDERKAAAMVPERWDDRRVQLVNAYTQRWRGVAGAQDTAELLYAQHTAEVAADAERAAELVEELVAILAGRTARLSQTLALPEVLAGERQVDPLKPPAAPIPMHLKNSNRGKVPPHTARVFLDGLVQQVRETPTRF